ncbi:hypothetical protein PF005_g30362 [Phytophthora fragariae]|uniref:Alcohol dehydrogenase-like N-terminal domain-containing protein n=1 Tax=Phytophthora fragariae TaxID=53985 RepID=A0A6A3SVW5_9STRA|nr:hypothetical protein PF007_g6599 [Phytophthora fragariae]KAE9163644.1 hypothetical protein PF005_g30362 [Phytophthora fragariae]
MAANLVFRHTDCTSHHTLRVTSEPRPVVGADEVLVQIRGVTLDYRDTIVANGTYAFPAKEDLIPCSDGAGVVVELGANVESLQPSSQRESLGGNIDSVLRQFIALPAQALTKGPDDCTLSFVQIASLVASGVTA